MTHGFLTIGSNGTCLLDFERSELRILVLQFFFCKQIFGSKKC